MLIKLMILTECLHLKAFKEYVKSTFEIAIAAEIPITVWLVIIYFYILLTKIRAC